MSERRPFRGIQRTDAQILAHQSDMHLLGLVQRQAVSMHPAVRTDLRRLAQDDCILAGFGVGSRATLLPRGERLLAAARGEHARPTDRPTDRSKSVSASADEGLVEMLGVHR